MKTENIVVKRKYHEYLECDICKERTHREHWGKGYNEKVETTVEIETGEYYSDESFGHVLSLDICPECFKTKLIPFLESLTDRKFRKEDF